MNEITRIATIVLVGMLGVFILLGWISKIRKKWGDLPPLSVPPLYIVSYLKH